MKTLGQGSATPVGALDTWLGTAQRRRARAKVAKIVRTETDQQDGETIRYDEVGWLNNLALGRGRMDEQSSVGRGRMRTSVVQTRETRVSLPSTLSSAMDCLLSSGSESESDGEVR